MAIEKKKKREWRSKREKAARSRRLERETGNWKEKKRKAAGGYPRRHRRVLSLRRSTVSVRVSPAPLSPSAQGLRPCERDGGCRCGLQTRSLARPVSKGGHRPRAPCGGSHRQRGAFGSQSGRGPASAMRDPATARRGAANRRSSLNMQATSGRETRSGSLAGHSPDRIRRQSVAPVWTVQPPFPYRCGSAWAAANAVTWLV